MNKDLLKTIVISAIVILSVKALIEKYLIVGILSNILTFFSSLIIIFIINEIIIKIKNK